MKKIAQILPLSILSFICLITSCSPEDEQELPNYSPVIFHDDFEWFTQGNLELNSWTNDVKVGNKPWKFETRNNNSYLLFTGFVSNNDVANGVTKDAVNESWIISKELDLDNSNKKRLTFISTQGFVSDTTKNDLTLYVIHNITNANADTVQLNFTKPVLGGQNFKWINSGIVNLEAFKGKIKIAFKATGSGTDGNADGTYEVDNIKVF